MFKFLLVSCVFCISLSALADENLLIESNHTDEVLMTDAEREVMGMVLKKTCTPHREEHKFPKVYPPESGTGYVEFEEGKAKITGSYKNGKMDGKWTYYWDNIVEETAEYSAEDPDEQGVWTSTFHEIYDDGPCEEYYGGKLLARYAYKNNKIDGIYEEYYPNGQLKSKKTYEQERLDGPYEEYFENGQLKVKTKKVEQIWRWPQNDGPYEEYFENGQLKEKSTYQLDENPQNGSDKVGPYEIYNEKGQLMEKRDSNGDMEIYYENGTLQFKGYREMDEEVYEKYYENGQLEEKKDKNYSEKYTENGRIIEKCNWYYSSQANCTFYNEDGTTSTGMRMMIY